MQDILIGKGQKEIRLQVRYANRHGLVAGATGTGKTITCKILAEGFSRLGIPVVISDAKGDVAGLSMPGVPSERIDERLRAIGVHDYSQEGSPVVFWDLWGEMGHPLRTTITEVGPTLLARILELNETQEGVLNVAFRAADDSGLLLLDLKDLRALLNFVGENRQTISQQYGLVNTASIGAIQRALLRLEDDGGDRFFSEPALELEDLMRRDLSGRGIINILHAPNLLLKPRLYSSFLLWLLSKLFEEMPEVGDLDKPKVVFFFDEAHLLFNDCPKALLQRVEQVVRLIRSKGVGVYFCSQYPDDIPDAILGQLGNKFQHALRAHTPRDQKSIRAAAETFAVNPALNVVEALTTLGVGEALVSTLGDRAVPQPVERTLIVPPRCRMGAISEVERKEIRMRSPHGGKYDQVFDRESAYELLKKQAEEAAAEAERQALEAERAKALRKPAGRQRQGVGEAFIKSAVRTMGTTIGRQIIRGVMGSLTSRR